MRYGFIILFFICTKFLVAGDYATKQGFITEDNALQILNTADSLYGNEEYKAALDHYMLMYGDTRYTKQIEYNIALTSYKAQRYTFAVHYCDKILESDSANTDALYVKALSLEKQGRLTEARQTMRKLITIAPAYDHVKSRMKKAGFALFVSNNWYYLLVIFIMLITLTILLLKGRKKNSAA